MARTRRNRRGAGADFWPGFVDAMATLLLVVTFLLSLFMLTQYFITQEASGKDTALQRLNKQITELTELLSLEKSQARSLEDELSSVSASLSSSKSEQIRLQGLLGSTKGETDEARERTRKLTSEVDEQRQISSEALARVELLNQQLSALRRQIAALEDALDASENRDKESQTRIADLGRRLNVALARKVQELERYRSDFFGRLRKILGDRENVRVVGDRFIFQAEVLFDSGSAEINPTGRAQITKLAEALAVLQNEIPEEVNWVLRVDGHTDIKPIRNARFPSNWELSSARAISVVRQLLDAGVPPKRLVAAGFGEFQPLDAGEDPESLRRNRRIELKLTEK